MGIALYLPSTMISEYTGRTKGRLFRFYHLLIVRGSGVWVPVSTGRVSSTKDLLAWGSNRRLKFLLDFCREGFPLRCIRCQLENPEGAKFCNKCGHPSAQSSVQAPKDLSFDEKLAKIQRYLPEGLT
jgi:hypothetical protein